MSDQTTLEKVSAKASTSRNKAASDDIQKKLSMMHSQIVHLQAELDKQKQINKQFRQGQTQEDVDKANEYIAAVHNKGFKKGMTWYEYYDRRLEKDGRRAPRHRAPLHTKPEEGQEAIVREWSKNVRWSGDGPFPYIFEPIKTDEAVA